MSATLKHRDYAFLGTTQSLCPECLLVVPAKIITRGERVYFRKHCPVHGIREDFVCADVAYYDQMQFSVPAKLPTEFGVEANRGCPLDCGLCPEHEQHTCIGLVELTSACNLTCPMCYAASHPGGKHLSLVECRRAIDRLVQVEGQPEVLQLSGGEPTLHPQFGEILDYAIAQPIDYVMINTNGIRFAHDPDLVRQIAKYRERVEVYFQMDGLDDDVFRALRGEPLLDVKQRALETLGQNGIHVTLVATLQPGVNDHQMGDLVRFGLQRPWITGLSFQPATYSGRHVLPEQLDTRITFPDVIKGIVTQTDGLFSETDFMPLPCAHPNCHSLAYAYRANAQIVPITRFFDAPRHYDLLANGISFKRPAVRDLIAQYMGRQACCGGDCSRGSEPRSEERGAGNVTQRTLPALHLEPQNGFSEWGREFFRKALDQQLGAEDVFRIVVTSFLDAYNFDVRRVMKCCTHHVLPSGHVIPFCAYNVLYRNGHVPLPPVSGP